LRTALLDLGVSEVVVEYSGGGDSGDVSDVSCKPAPLLDLLASRQIEIRRESGAFQGAEYVYQVKSMSCSIRQALQDFTLNWVSQDHSGWENNDGGSGSLRIDVLADSFTLNHTEYYQESTDYEYVL
jgi:hypothetical protein